MKIKTCRICLALDVKVFKLGNTEGKHFIENVFQQNGYNEKLQDFHFICFECKALLDKSYNFIKRVLKAQEILFHLMAENKSLTPSILKQVDRSITGLNLVEHYNNIDIYITENENGIKKEHTESACSKSEPEIVCKVEVDFDPDPLNNRELEIDLGLKLPNKPTEPSDFKNDTKDPNIKFDYVDPSNSFPYNASFDNSDNDVNQYEFDDVNLADLVKEEALDNSVINTSKVCTGKRKEKGTGKRKKKVTLKQSRLSTCKSKTIVQRKKDVSTQKKIGRYGPRREQLEYGGDTLCNESGQAASKPEAKYPAKCEHCSYEIPNRTAHFHHYLIEHKDKKYPHALSGKQFVCQFCGIVSMQKSRHIDHELTHAMESNFTCAQCPKRFANKQRLRKHTYRSHPARMLECDYCGKKVKARESLMIHIRMHTGEKPFKCPLCGAGFAHRGNIRPHIRANHDQPYLDQINLAPNIRQTNRKVKFEPKDPKQLYGPKDTMASYESDDKLCS